jgi:hypothetical protein
MIQQGYRIVARLEPLTHAPAPPDAPIETIALVPEPWRSRLSQIFADDVRSIVVSNDLRAPSHRFTLQLVARRFSSDASWERILLPYTVIRLGVVGPDGAFWPLIVGFIDSASRSGEYSGATPEMTVSVSGRSLGGLLEDHAWWFHSAMSDVLLRHFDFADLRQWYAPDADLRLLRDVVGREQALRLTGLMALDSRLFDKLINATPVDVARAIWDHYVGNDNEAGRIALYLPGRTLATQLKLDADPRNMFDAYARLTFPALPTTMPTGSAWRVLRAYLEPWFFELFSRVVGSSLDNAHIQYVARKPPFSGHIGERDGRLSVVTSGGYPGPGRSTFDAEFGAWNRSAETRTIAGSDVFGHGQIEVSIEGAYTMYRVLPLAFSAGGAGGGHTDIASMVPPLPDDDTRSPSFIGRLGVRLLDVQTKYLSPVQADGAPGDVNHLIRRIMLYQVMLRTWYFLGPAFRTTTYYLRFRPDIDVGHRVYDTELSQEGYVTHVRHVGQATGASWRWQTVLKAERGWWCRDRP